jgi:hypothetical protein
VIEIAHFGIDGAHKIIAKHDGIMRGCQDR